LGKKSVFYLNPRESHIPERAVIKSDKAVSGEFTKGYRPIRFLHPPEPISAIALLPDSAPVQIRWRGELMRIAQAEGPERIEPEWWVSGRNAVTRDYYYVESTDGRRLWVFKQGFIPIWYVHGIFA
jgi:protein ImuB